MDIPVVDDNFETNVPGMFIAGELGGMGLIRNAIEQGKAAMKAIGKTLPAKPWAFRPVLPSPPCYECVANRHRVGFPSHRERR